MDEFLKTCQECTEVELWCIINQLGGCIWGINHDWADGRFTPSNPAKMQEELNQMRKQIELAVDQVSRFGIEHPRIDGGPTPEYNAWFDNWHTYIEKTLSNEELNQLQQDLNQKTGLEKWRPAKTWQEVFEASKRLPFPTTEQIQSHLSIYPRGKVFRHFCSLIKGNPGLTDFGASNVGLSFYFAYCELKQERRHITEKTKTAILALIDALFPENKPFAAATKESYIYHLNI